MSATATAESYNKLKDLLREANSLQEIDGILGYDEQVFMPKGAAASRAEQKATLAKIIHEKRTGAEMKAAIDSVRGLQDTLEDERMRANVRDAVEDFDKGARKSPELAAREARLESEAFAAWQSARAASDFSLFADKLVEIFQIKKEIAGVTRPGVADPYDGALDAFERGMTAERLDVIFAEVRRSVFSGAASANDACKPPQHAC